MPSVPLSVAILAGVMMLASTAVGQVTVTFDNDPNLPLQGYSVTVVGDVNWFALNFGISPDHSISNVNSSDFDFLSTISSNDGGKYYDALTADTSTGFVANSPIFLMDLILVAPGGLGGLGMIMGILDSQVAGSESVGGGVFDKPFPQVNALLCEDGSNIGTCDSGAGGSLRVVINNVPEPTSVGLLALGLLGLAFVQRWAP